MDVGREVAQRILHSQLKQEPQSGITLMRHGERSKCYSTLWEEAEKEENIKKCVKEIDRECVCWLRTKPIRISVVAVMYVLLP